MFKTYKSNIFKKETFFINIFLPKNTLWTNQKVYIMDINTDDNIIINMNKLIYNKLLNITSSATKEIVPGKLTLDKFNKKK